MPLTPSTAMKFRPKFFWKWSFFDQNQQPLKSVEPFERNLRGLFISQCPYKFSSFLDLRNASNRFRLFSRDFRLYGFFFPGSACFSSLASPRNLPSWVKYYRKFERFGKEFRWTIAVERVRFQKPKTKKARLWATCNVSRTPWLTLLFDCLCVRLPFIPCTRISPSKPQS